MPRQAKIPTPRFNLKSHQNKNDEVLIVLVYRYSIPSTKEKVRIVHSTGEKVIPKYWDNKALAKITRNHPEYASLNDRLYELARIAKEIFQDFQFGEITEQEFKNELDYRTGVRERPEQKDSKDQVPTFMEYVELFIQERIQKRNSKRGTWKMLRTCANHLIEFNKDRGKDLDYEDFDYNFRNDFENWLYLKPREHSTNYAAKMLSLVRQFLHEATRRGFNQNMTFMQKGWTIKKEKTRRPVLSLEELKYLYELDLSDNPRLDRVRDSFLIGCFTGLRFSDFTRIRPEHIVREDGVEMIQLFTQKTDTEVVIPLMPELKAILEKHNYRSPKSISNQKMNQYLKEIFEKAGFNQEIVVKKSIGGQVKELVYKKYELAQTHMARRSFATNFYQLGIASVHLMLITGHSTEKQFFEYININKIENAKTIAKQVGRLMRNQLRIVN